MTASVRALDDEEIHPPCDGGARVVEARDGGPQRGTRRMQRGDVGVGRQPERERHDVDRMRDEPRDLRGVVVVVPRRLTELDVETLGHGLHLRAQRREGRGIRALRPRDEEVDAGSDARVLNVTDLVGQRVDVLVAAGEHAPPAGAR